MILINSYKCLFVFAILIIFSCKDIQKETIIYFNNFESGRIEDINNPKIESFNGSRVLGRYSEGGFVLQLKGVRPHDMIQISFDLYIHDTWDGNDTGSNGRDIWIMNIDGGSSIYSTFANGACINCTQSYPDPQPGYVNNSFIFAQNKPNSNAIKTDLPGACELKDVKGGTSMYRIQRTFPHTDNKLDLGCFGQLEHPDPSGKNCNESWSVDNIKITAIEFR